MSELRGNFVNCGYPKYKDGEIIGWICSYVKLSEIKHVHHNNDKNCFIYTYKDQWYSCHMNINDLIDAINENLKGNSHGAHGSEANRDHIGRDDL